jgi:hypothetical protein
MNFVYIWRLVYPARSATNLWFRNSFCSQSSAHEPNEHTLKGMKYWKLSIQLSLVQVGDCWRYAQESIINNSS